MKKTFPSLQTLLFLFYCDLIELFTILFFLCLFPNTKTHLVIIIVNCFALTQIEVASECGYFVRWIDQNSFLFKQEPRTNNSSNKNKQTEHSFIVKIWIWVFHDVRKTKAQNSVLNLRSIAVVFFFRAFTFRCYDVFRAREIWWWALTKAVHDSYVSVNSTKPHFLFTNETKSTLNTQNTSLSEKSMISIAP